MHYIVFEITLLLGKTQVLTLINFCHRSLPACSFTEHATDEVTFDDAIIAY